MFKNLKEELDRKGITIRAVASLLNCSEKTIQNKLNGETEFTLSEVLLIGDNLFPEFRLHYLFKRSA